MSAREVVLARIAAALEGAGPPPAIPRTYRQAGSRPASLVCELFVERVRDYGAEVVVTSDPATAVATALAQQGARRAVIAPDLEPALRPGDVELVEDAGLSPAELDAFPAALTRARCGCAETGTVALDGGPGQGRRALSLVPDLHVCVIRAADIVETVPELVEGLAASTGERRPIVLVSGPSATSDIELIRVEGVHGPRRLVVVVALGPDAGRADELR